MSFEATIARKKALEAATKAVEQADLLTVKHNETIEEVGKIRKGLAGLTEHTTKRLDAQLEMIGACEKRAQAAAHEVSRVGNKLAEDVHAIRTTFANEQRYYVDTQDKAIERRFAAAIDAEINARAGNVQRLRNERRHFERMGLFARLRWLVTGHVPHAYFGPKDLKVERGMVSAGALAARPVGDPGTGPAKPHETPRSTRSLESVQASLDESMDTIAARDIGMGSHETPRSAKTARSREEAEALVR